VDGTSGQRTVTRTPFEGRGFAASTETKGGVCLGHSETEGPLVAEGEPVLTQGTVHVRNRGGIRFLKRVAPAVIIERKISYSPARGKV